MAAGISLLSPFSSTASSSSLPSNLHLPHPHRDIFLLHPHSCFLKSPPLHPRTTVSLLVRRQGNHADGLVDEDGPFRELPWISRSVADKKLNRNEWDESNDRRAGEDGAYDELELNAGDRKFNMKGWDASRFAASQNRLRRKEWDESKDPRIGERGADDELGLNNGARKFNMEGWKGSTVSQNVRISPRRLSRSIGSRSRPSQATIPGKHSKYSERAKAKTPDGDRHKLQSSTPGKYSEQARSGTAIGYSSSSPAFSHVSTFKPEEGADSDFELSNAEGDLGLHDFSFSLHGSNAASRVDSSTSLSWSNQSEQGPDFVTSELKGSFSSEREEASTFKPKKIPTTSNDSSISPKIEAFTVVPGHTLSDLPFEPQYSYSECPKVAPIGYREPQYSPFGPSTMGRPWTGRAPLKPSKKKLPEFDSFNPPPRGKKGVKYVQNPGPFPENQVPREVKSREEILGEPLSQKEVQELMESCMREKRQINLGRDGLIHNMLDLIHAHWKRRRVCKIKCKGVPTVDMDNVCFHIEDKTGGKIIHRAGGVVYLFRGRYYNYKDRPRIPIMLWKPATPIYPKLIQPAPGGLTSEEATELRKIGRKVVPICKLGKNGVYLNLVKDVREAFRVDELVRVNCQGLNPSDYKKIGAKLQDLVPCVLLSFEKEHILMWRGRDLNSDPVIDDGVDEASIAQTTSILPSSETRPLLVVENAVSEQNDETFVQCKPFSDSGGTPSSLFEDAVSEQNDESCAPAMLVSETVGTPVESYGKAMPVLIETNEVECDLEDVDVLWRHAIESGTALVLEDTELDSDFIFEKAIEFAKVAPPTPPYTRSLLAVLNRGENETEQNSVETKACKIQVRGIPKKKTMQTMDPPLLEVPPLGGLEVDELARLLSP